jgi:bacillithiol biosynthesis cysteine-adding enzyme BshC
MNPTHIPLVQTGQINKLTADYLLRKNAIAALYEWVPDRQGIANAIAGRNHHPVNRKFLAEVFRKQYAALEPDFFSRAENAAVIASIEALGNENTFTITTGHQICLFTGPLYFIYKIISAITYARQLKAAFPDKNFLPVYWMATEDHDLEEINHFYLWNRQMKWETTATGAVGRMSTKGIESLINQLEELLTGRTNVSELLPLFRKAYLQHDNLSQATRCLVHELFRQEGLLILDPDDASLKSVLAPLMERDIFKNVFHAKINDTVSTLSATYKIPVTPREINVFYLTEEGRSRIVREGDAFKALDTDKQWNTAELKQELYAHPENFSPNVVMRPMYQELILPNLVYIGGNNEIAYWLELKAAFKEAGLFFPQLVVRDSALWIGQKAAKDLSQLKVEIVDLFLPKPELTALFYDRNEMKHPAEEELETLAASYDSLREHLQGLPSDIVAAMVKQSNLHSKELKKWKGDIRKKQMELQEKSVQKLDKIYDSIFPEGSFQERHDNFIAYYIQYGSEFFNALYQSFDPLAAQLHVLMEEV